MKNMAACGHFSASDGYSFIELLVAITILGFVIAPLLGLFTGSFQAIASAGRETTALYLGQEKLESLKAKGFDFVYQHYAVSENSPFLEEDLPHHDGIKRITEVKTLKPPGTEEGCISSGLLKLEITVSYMLRGREQELVLSSYLSER